LHGANAIKANAPSLDGSSRSRHTYCGLFRATVDAQVGQNTARQAQFCHSRLVTKAGYFCASHIGAIPEAWTSVAHYKMVARPEEGLMGCFWRDVWLDEEGQDIAEYAVMLAVILVIVVGTVRLIGSNANNAFSQVGSALQ
jgi:Flp pilus assembly pilin Flp